MKKVLRSTLVLLLFSTSSIFAQNSNTLRVTIAGNGYADQTIIRLLDGATPDFDGAYDAWKFISPDPAVPSIYTKIPSNDDLSINSLPLYENDTTIGIHTNVPSAGLYTITVEEVFAFDDDLELSITDVGAEETYPLNGSVASFTSMLLPNTSTTTFTFNIFKTLTTAIQPIEVKDNVVIATKGNGNFDLFFKDNTIEEITVYDITGKTVLYDNINQNNYNLSLENYPTGLYIIAITNGNETIIKKVFR